MKDDVFQQPHLQKQYMKWLVKIDLETWLKDRSTPYRNFSNFFLKTTISVISVQILLWVSMRNFFYVGKYINK